MTLRLFAAAVMLGLAAYWLARGVGIPAWRHFVPGDATDIGAAVFAATMLLGRPE